MKTFNQALHLNLFWTLLASWSAVAILGLGADKLTRPVLGASILALLCVTFYFYRKSWVQVSRIEAKGREGLCFKTALDSLKAKTMLVDEHGIICYYNTALYKWFRQHETGVEREIVGFTASRLAGQRLSILFNEDEQLKTLLATLSSPLVLKKNFAGFDMVLHFIPLIDLNDNRLGVAIEWGIEEAPTMVLGTQAKAGEQKGKMRLNEARLKENLGAFSNILLQTKTLQAAAEKLDAHLQADDLKFFDVAQTLFELAKESEASRNAILKVIQESASINQSRGHAS